MGYSRMLNKSMAACLHPTDVKVKYSKKIIRLVDEYKKFKQAKKESAALINFCNFMISSKNAKILINKTKHCCLKIKQKIFNFSNYLKQTNQLLLEPWIEKG